MGLKVVISVSLAALAVLLSWLISFDLIRVVEALSGMTCHTDGVCELQLLL